MTEKLIVKLGLSFLNLSWFISLRFCAVLTKMAWLTTFPTSIRMCWNSSSVKLAVRKIMPNGFQWFNNTETSNKQSKSLLIDLLMMSLTASNIRCHIMVTSIQLFIELAELIKISWIMIDNQVCFSQLIWKFSLKLTVWPGHIDGDGGGG